MNRGFVKHEQRKQDGDDEKNEQSGDGRLVVAGWLHRVVFRLLSAVDVWAKIIAQTILAPQADYQKNTFRFVGSVTMHCADCAHTIVFS